MSKIHVPAQDKKPSKKSIFAHMAAHAATVKAKLSKNEKLSIVLACFILGIMAVLSYGVTGVICAGLYIYADNGKKSGRWDGNVYMRNGRTRAFKVPALVQNTYTQTQRVQLGLLSAAWRALTPADQLSWNNLEGLFRSNRFGFSVAVRGKAAYILCNMNLFNAGIAPISTAPVLVDVPCITSNVATATAATGSLSLAFAPTPTDANVAHLLFATAMKGSGVFKPSQSAYRLIDVIPPAQATPYASLTNWTNKYGTMTVGQKIFIKTVGIQITTGQAAPALAIETIIV